MRFGAILTASCVILSKKGRQDRDSQGILIDGLSSTHMPGEALKTSKWRCDDICGYINMIFKSIK